MSDEQSDHLSAEGSSLSLFSGLGTSSVSGTSESGGLPPNVDELSDSRLEQVVEDAKSSLRKGSGAAVPGSTDSTSETDSQPATSLLEVSHRSGGGGGQPGSLSRRRSGSRASLGSRVKSLRLTDEQKCGVASREVERIEHDLSDFRVNSRRENRNGVAQIDEKAAFLEELEKRRAQLTKGLTACRTKRRNEYNSQSLYELFQAEESDLIKHGERLKNRLENTQGFEELQRRNAAVVDLRGKVTAARKRRFAYQEQLREEEARGRELEAELKRLEGQREGLKAALPKLKRTLSRRVEESESLRRRRESSYQGRQPTVDDYFRVKIEEERRKNRLKVEERQRNIRELRSKVEKQHEIRRRKRAKSAVGRLMHGGGTWEQGTIVRGRTYNLEFSMATEEEGTEGGRMV